MVLVQGYGGGLKATGRVTVGLAAVLMRVGNVKRLSLIIKNEGTGNVFIGNASVSTTTAPTLASGGTMTLDNSNDDTWVVADAANTVVSFLEEFTP